MQLNDFINIIDGKIFVSIENNQDVLDFTSLDSTGVALRNAAVSKGVIVFLPTINKIFARSSYYGVEETTINDLQISMTSLNEDLNTLNGLVSELTSIVEGHSESLSSYSETISSHTESINNILSDISKIQTLLGDLPENTTLSEYVNDLIEEKLNDYVTLSKLETELAHKANVSEFNAFKTDLLNRLNQFDNENETVETVIRVLKNSISGIPKFDIVIVPNRNELDNIQNPSLTTIYIIPKTNEDDNEEIFTEFIWVNRNYGKTDPDTGEPLPDSYGWEKLGSQEFRISNMVSKEYLAQELSDIITQVEGKVPDWLVGTVEENSGAIANLRTRVASLENSINILIDNEGNLLFTGEDINTTSEQNSNTIAIDISNLSQRIESIGSPEIEWTIIDQ